MANPGVEYTIAVTKTGAGAAQATADFNAVKQAAEATNGAFNNTQTTTAGMAKGFKALNGVLVVAGLQTFPQLTAGVMVAKTAIDGLRASGVAMSAGIGTISMGIAGLTALVITGAAAWASYAAEKNEALTAKNLEDQTQMLTDALTRRLAAAKEEGAITNETWAKLGRTLGTIAGNRQVQDFLQDLRQGNAGDMIGEQQRGFANTRAQLANANPNFATDKKQQQLQLQSEYNDQVKLYNVLRADGMITEQQLTAYQMEADTNRLNSLVQLRGHLTDLQLLGRQAAEMFAGGLSNAIVKAFTEGGKAFKEFAQQFLAQMAQMIMQAAIMRMLFGATGQSSGTGGLIGGFINGAASGGMFPQMMAAGGMAGVKAVSSPTYFPRFNVLAGEAGREMMTVLARPRMMEVGGMQAVVGSAQGRQLAITSANDLARGGAGGSVDIRVTLGPELRAEIVNESVQGARVTVAQDMRTDSPISRGVKGLTA